MDKYKFPHDFSQQSHCNIHMSVSHLLWFKTDDPENTNMGQHRVQHKQMGPSPFLVVLVAKTIEKKQVMTIMMKTLRNDHFIMQC